MSHVQIASAVKDGLLGAENAAIGVDHGGNDISVDFSRAFIWTNGNVVVVNVTPRHGDLKMVGTQKNGATFATNVRPSGTDEQRLIRTGRFEAEANAARRQN